MAKKKGAKKFFSGLKSKAIPLVMDFLEREAGNLVAWVKDLMHLKEKIRKIVISAMLVLVGTIILVLGVTNYLAEVFLVSPGLIQMIGGLLLIIAAKVYKKS